MQDLYGMGMACYDDGDWARQQAHDEELMHRELTEAFVRLYKARDELEVLYNCELPDLSADIRLIEMEVFRK